MDIRLALMCGADIPIPDCALVVHQPKIKEIAYIGDDVIDIPVFEKVGFSATPQDAHPYAKENCDYVCKLNGGEGAVREICDLIMLAQNVNALTPEKSLWSD